MNVSGTLEKNWCITSCCKLHVVSSDGYVRHEKEMGTAYGARQKHLISLQLVKTSCIIVEVRVV